MVIRSMAFATVAVASLAPGASGEFLIAPQEVAPTPGAARLTLAAGAQLSPGAQISFRYSPQAGPGFQATSWLAPQPLAINPLRLSLNDNGR